MSLPPDSSLPPDLHWQRLARAASRESLESAPSAPPCGFSTRVAAQAMAARRRRDDPAAWVLRRLLPACVLPVAAAAAFFAWTSSTSPVPSAWPSAEMDPLILLEL